jgi:hypothetical protein
LKNNHNHTPSFLILIAKIIIYNNNWVGHPNKLNQVM